MSSPIHQKSPLPQEAHFTTRLSTLQGYYISAEALLLQILLYYKSVDRGGGRITWKNLLLFSDIAFVNKLWKHCLILKPCHSLSSQREMYWMLIISNKCSSTFSLPAYMQTCISVCRSVCLPAYLPACLSLLFLSGDSQVCSSKEFCMTYMFLRTSALPCCRPVLMF